jgi:hypothetical protein
MASIYKQGTKWVVTGEAKYLLDSGTCIAVESADGTYLQLKLIDTLESILYAKYVLITDSAGAVYTKEQVLLLLEEFLVSSPLSLSLPSGQPIAPNGTPTKIIQEITRPADILAYLAGDAINVATAAVKQKHTVTLSGTSGSVNISIPNIANRTIAFTVDLTTTAAAFVTTYAADFLPLVVVTSSGAGIIFEAATAGVPFEAPVVVNTIADLTGAVVQTTANLTLAPIEFANASIVTGGGGFLGLIKLESNITTLATGKLRLWFFNDTPSNIVGDNVPYINSYVNSSKRCFRVDVEFDALLAGSDTVFGQSEALFNEYITTGTSMYCLVQTLSAFIPTSGGKIKISLSLLKIA